MSLKININGKKYEAETGEYILDVCHRSRILVPTLCHHESLSGIGTCRLCIVEVNEGNGNRVVVSCVYPLNRDCVVFTESEKIKRIRKTILSMLKTRAPAGDRLASLCQIYGVKEDDRFTPPGTMKKESRIRSRAAKHLEKACILCGLCAQACASLGSGAGCTAGGAISTTSRGITKKISTPFGEPSADCIGCGSCALVCPTKAIKCSEGKGHRSIWGKKFKLLSCDSCGKFFATQEEYAYALGKSNSQGAGGKTPDPEPGGKAGISGAYFCEACRRKKSADVFAGAFGSRT